MIEAKLERWLVYNIVRIGIAIDGSSTMHWTARLEQATLMSLEDAVARALIADEHHARILRIK